MSQTYKSVSIGVLDISGPEKDFIVINGWVLDAVLDPIKVENALAKLVDIWPILSARLRTKPDGSWEYQIPTEFSTERPKYIFRSITRTGPIVETYRYPTPSKQISRTIDQEQHVDLFAEGGPRSTRDYFNNDIPLIRLHLTNFDDGSILGLTTPHVLCDGHGSKEIAIALSKLLKGEEVLPLKEEDPLELYVHHDTPPEAPEGWKVLGPLQIIILVVYMVWNIISTRNIQTRILYIPTPEVERIKAEAMSDLKRERPDDKDAWVSTSDAIGAFLLKNTYIRCTSKKSLNVAIIANVRNYLQNAMPSPYLHNGAWAVAIPTMPVADVAKKPLGELAYIFRQTIRKWTRKESVEARLQWRFANAGRPVVFFEPTGMYNMITNWREMKMMHIDFSGGLPQDSTVKEIHCVYGYAKTFQPHPIRNLFAILHDDPRGGLWVLGVLPQSTWEQPEGFGRFL